MKIQFQKIRSNIPKTDLLAIPFCEGEQPFIPNDIKVTKIGMSNLDGKWKEMRIADTITGPTSRILHYSLGKKKDIDVERIRRFAAISVKTAESLKAKNITILASHQIFNIPNAYQAIAEGVRMGIYRFEKYKSKPNSIDIKNASVLYDSSNPYNLRSEFEKGLVLAEANVFVRDLQNSPGNKLTPKDLASVAQSLAKENRITVQIFDENHMKKMGMGLLLGVAQGSREKPRLIHLTYKTKNRSKGKIALVGKGVTFDAGGISIKAPGKMDEMRYDMSGAGAVLGVFHALREIDVPWEVNGVVVCTENMPGGGATKPGDIHTAMNGTTVEVLNTDAEGRLILADALCYTKLKINPDTIVDIATLTGGVIVALGHELSGMFANTNKLRDELLLAGKETGENLWPLPLLDIHKEGMKGQYADLKNIPTPDIGTPSSSGAAFLSHFVGNTEWAHLDIAGTAYGGSNRDWVGGPLGSGVGTRLLIQ